MIFKVDREMINISASPVMAAQHGPDDSCSVNCNSAQIGIAFQEAPDRLAIVAFSNVETLHPVPKFNGWLIIFDSKLPYLNLHRATFYHVDHSTRVRWEL